MSECQGENIHPGKGGQNEYNRWLSLPDNLRWAKPNPDDYSDEESYDAAEDRWWREVEGYEMACERADDREREAARRAAE